MTIIDKILNLIPRDIRLNYYVKLHNNLYQRISSLAKNMNRGIHPKLHIMKFHNYFIDNIDENSTILDVGCGDGSLTFQMAKKAKKVVAIDIEKTRIENSIKNHNRKNIEYICSDIVSYELSEKFDYVTLSNVLEHIQKRKELLRKIKPYATFLIIRVPQIDRTWLPLYKKMMGYEYRLDYTHYIEYSFESFKKEIEYVGLKIVSYRINFGEIWARIKT